MIDINELRRLAQAASHPMTKGRWIRLFGERTVYDRMEDGCRGIPVVSTDTHPPAPFEAACLDFIAAANPSAISELLDCLEAAMAEIKSLRAELKAAHAMALNGVEWRELAQKYEAEIEEMKQQEPVAQVGVHKTGGNAGIAWSARPLNEFDSLPLLCDGDKLYLAPGSQPAPSVPECPYPCGWKNLLTYAIKDGAYLARAINEDEPVTENARAVTMRMVMRLRDVLLAINNAAPEAKP